MFLLLLKVGLDRFHKSKTNFLNFDSTNLILNFDEIYTYIKNFLKSY